MSLLFKRVISFDIIQFLVCEFLTDDDAIALIRCEREINAYYHRHPYDLKRMIDYFFTIPIDIVTTSSTANLVSNNTVLNFLSRQTRVETTNVITRQRLSSTIRARKRKLDCRTRVDIDMSNDNILELYQCVRDCSKICMLPPNLQSLNKRERSIYDPITVATIKQLPLNLRSLCIGRTKTGSSIMEYFPFLPSSLTSLDVIAIETDKTLVSVPSMLNSFSCSGCVYHFHFEETSQLTKFHYATQSEHSIQIHPKFPSSLTDLFFAIPYEQLIEIDMPISLTRLSLHFFEDVDNDLGKIIFPLKNLKTLQIYGCERLTIESSFPPTITNLSLSCPIIINDGFNYLENLVSLQRFSLLESFSPLDFLASVPSLLVEFETNGSITWSNSTEMFKWLKKLTCKWIHKPSNPPPRNLLSLTLTNSYVKNIDEIIDELPKTLTHLDVSLSKICITNFTHLFSRLPDLKTLKLNHYIMLDENVVFPSNLVQLFVPQNQTSRFRQFQTPQTKFVVITT